MHWFHRFRLVAIVSTFALLSAALPAAAWTSDDGRRPAPSTRVGTVPAPHVQRRPITPDLRPPLPTSRDHLYARYDDPALPRIAAGCNSGAIAAAFGSALVAVVKSNDTSCISELFGTSGPLAAQLFAEAKMVTIANALQTDAPSYAGNNSAAILQLVLFLRAGYYVQYYQPEVVGDYGPTLAVAIRNALDAFVVNPHFGDINDAHGAVLSEFVTLIDSAGENAHQLQTVRTILASYGAAHRPLWYMKSAVNSAFSVLFRGHYNDDFRAMVQGSGSGVIDTLAEFIANNRSADVGTDRQYLLQNAAGELARFLQYPAPLHTTVHPKVRAVLDQFSLTGPGAGIYVRTGDIADYFDNAHCAYFGLCTFAQDLEAAVLPAGSARDCSPTLRVRSQALSAVQLDNVCAVVGAEEGYFHNQSQTFNTPVANDHNTRLEMVIFHSSIDYETYSGVIFGNDTNNGGVYLEGDPSNPANQARFLAYEAEWLRPGFEVWNLTHEYIHYLDGRFNWFGSFGAMPLDAPYSAVWYIEGFAEYLSYSYRGLVYTRAVTEAGNPDRFTLSALFDTEYSSDYVRTYQWGYLAARFMFERHRGDIANLYLLTRTGNYSPGYRNWLDGQRQLYNAEFRAWVQCLGQHGGDTANCNAPVGDAIFVNGFEASTTR